MRKGIKMSDINEDQHYVKIPVTEDTEKVFLQLKKSLVEWEVRNNPKEVTCFWMKHREAEQIAKVFLTNLL